MSIIDLFPWTDKPAGPVYVGYANPVQTATSRGKLDARTLGALVPFVVGTGKVDGKLVAGGISTITTITGYNVDTVEVTAANAIDYVGLTHFTYSSGGTGGNLYTLYEPTFGAPTGFKKVITPVSTTKTVAKAIYVLAYDPFERGYNLIRLEVDGKLVFDSELGIGSNTIHFYGGRQTAPDPIISDIIGASAGAYQNFVILALDGYDASNAPQIKAVISNAVAHSGTRRIAWTGEAPDTFDDITGYREAYDPTSGLIYQLLERQDIASLSAYYLAVLDTNTARERYRVALEDTGTYIAGSGRAQIMAIRGSGHVLVRLHTGGPGVNRIYDAASGRIVAEQQETAGMEIRWTAGQPIGNRYVFIGYNFHSVSPTNIHFGVADLTTSTFTVEDGGQLYNDPGVRGRSSGDRVSFFTGIGPILTSPEELQVWEHVFDGDTWTSTLVYTSALGIINGLHYDPLTQYLVVTTNDSGTFRVAYINPDTGAIIDQFTSANTLLNYSDGFLGGFEKFWSRPGFALFVTYNPGEIVTLLDIAENSFSTFADTIPFGSYWVGAIFDQNRVAYFSAHGDTNWTEYRNQTTAGTITLQSALTDIMSIPGFTSGDLTFVGFDGYETYGTVIESDTTTIAVVKTFEALFGFSWCDTGAGIYFKMPGRDDDFGIDITLTADDLVERQGGAVQSRDEADLRTPSKIILDYVSADQGFDSRPASFSMPTGVTESIRTEKYETSIGMSDVDAQQFTVERFLDLQSKRRDHSIYLGPDQVQALPGDIISVPSGSTTYITRVEQIDIDLRNMAMDISARDFQSEVETTVTAVTDNAGVAQIISFASQYIHLDTPLFNYSDDLGGTGLLQYGVVASRGQDQWIGGVLFRGDTPLELSPLFDQAPHRGVVGACETELGNPPDPFGTTDPSTVTIRMTGGNDALFVDATEAQVLAGRNNAFIGAPGRWEWVGYKTATEVSTGVWTLSGFARRGYRGTEVFCDTHDVSDIFVMLSPEWLRKAPHPLSDLDKTRYYKALGIGQDPIQGTVLPHSIIGAAETPYAPINLAASVASPNGIDIGWDYRSRLSLGTNPADSGEATLAFEIDIYATDGVTYKRTLTSTTNFVHYGTADVTTDFGSDPPTELFFRVYMMSALDILVPGQDRPVAGRGYEARGHVNFSTIGEPIGLLLTLTKA